MKGWLGGGKKPRLQPNISGLNQHNASAASSNWTKAGKQSAGSYTEVFIVKIPEAVRPGDEFQVHAGGRLVRVRCPPGASPGQFLAINVPRNSTSQSNVGGASGAGDEFQRTSSTSVTGSRSCHSICSENFSNFSLGEAKIDDYNQGVPQAHTVEIPQGILGGQYFPTTIAGNTFMVTCPLHAVPGNKVRIVPPPPEPMLPPAIPECPPQPKKEEQTFEVVVPMNVKGGQSFAVLAGVVRVQVVCPKNAKPGQKIRFRLPLALTRKPIKQTGLAAKPFGHFWTWCESIAKFLHFEIERWRYWFISRDSK
ncbi:hypothetical protein ACA910_022249 [Epithemia clementina (nom. ined.)]